MADTESIRQIAHSRAPLSTWLGIVLLFALFGVIVLAVIGPMPRGSDYEETRAKKRMETLKTVREDGEKTLNTYAWIDKNKGIVRIPISRAMELTTTELAKQKPAPAGPIATPQAESPAPPAQGGSQKPGTPQSAASPSAPAPAASASPAAQAAASPQTQASASPPPAAPPAPSAAASASPATTP